MDSRIWAGLPDHLMDGILARLPVQSLLCFRCVCKRWKELMDSTNFLDFHSRVHSSTPWLLMFKRQDRMFCRAYDSFLNKWRILSLTFLRSPISEVAVACRGLLCFRVGVSGTLVVCNPLTKTCKELPATAYYHRRSPVAMVVEQDSNSFKILVAGSESDSLNTKTILYDSQTNSWRRTADLPFRTELRSETSHCDGVFYFTTSEPITILAYNIKQEVWTKLPAPLPQSLTCARLVVTQNSVFLVTGHGAHGISRNLYVWQLQQDMQWMEVQKIPDMMCREFLGICYHTYEHICCIGHTDYICLFCCTSPKVLVYKVSRKTWHWFPNCPILPDKASGSFSWVSLDPNLCSLP